MEKRISLLNDYLSQYRYAKTLAEIYQYRDLIQNMLMDEWDSGITAERELAELREQRRPHKWPEEKPPSDGEYPIYIWGSWTVEYYNTKFESFGYYDSEDIVYWMSPIPEPPDMRTTTPPDPMSTENSIFGESA